MQAAATLLDCSMCAPGTNTHTQFSVIVSTMQYVGTHTGVAAEMLPVHLHDVLK